MLFINSADWHFSNYSSDPVIKSTGLSEKLNSLVTTINNMIQYGRENKIKNQVVGGDVLHNKSVVHTFAMSVLIDLFKNNSDIEFILLNGNHDESSRSSDSVSGLKALDFIPNVHVISEVEKIENILFVPWKHSTKELFQKEKSDYLLSHFGLSEAMLNSGISIVSDISMKDLSNFKYVLLGHYHKNQYLKNEHTELYYSGSVIQIDWGEKNEEKRFLIVDTIKNTIKSIPTIGYKKYIELEINNDNRVEIIKEVEKYKKDGNKVKLLIKNEFSYVDDIPKDIIVVDKQEKDITQRGLTSGMSSADRLIRYMEIKGIPVGKQTEYKNIALDIIDKVSSEAK